MNETIEMLRKCAAAISDTADRLAEQFEGIEPAVPPAEPALTLEAVRAVLADKSRNGYTAEVRELLQKHGADRLSQIPPERYRSLLLEAEVLGDG